MNSISLLFLQKSQRNQMNSLPNPLKFFQKSIILLTKSFKILLAINKIPHANLQGGNELHSSPHSLEFFVGSISFRTKSHNISQNSSEDEFDSDAFPSLPNPLTNSFENIDFTHKIRRKIANTISLRTYIRTNAQFPLTLFFYYHTLCEYCRGQICCFKQLFVCYSHVFKYFQGFLQKVNEMIIVPKVPL